jgi:transposase
MIHAVLERCAGIDVGKKTLAVCLMKGGADAEPELDIRSYGTTVSQLEALRQWLREEGCTHVVMESTGCYWEPVFNILEDSFTIVLANPMEVKCRRGHKTDWLDCRWLAHLLRHAMLHSSFIPPRPLRELRDLTRRRKQLVRNAVQEKNRVLKTLEKGNIKLGNVLSDVFGVSGQAMVHGLLLGHNDAQQLAKLARGRARNKRLELIAALDGHRLTESQRSLIRRSLRHLEFLAQEIESLDLEIRAAVEAAGLQRQMEWLQTIPGIQEYTAASILAEIGPDMQQFPSAGHVSSWAGLCPGSNVSAGIVTSRRTTKGNRWLRDTMTEAAWAGCKTKGSGLQAMYRRLVPRRGKNRAVIAVAHKLLVIVYYVLLRGVPYQKSREEEAEQRSKSRRIRYHLRTLAKLGITLDPSVAVTVTPTG